VYLWLEPPKESPDGDDMNKLPPPLKRVLVLLAVLMVLGTALLARKELASREFSAHLIFSMVLLVLGAIVNMGLFFALLCLYRRLFWWLTWAITILSVLFLPYEIYRHSIGTIEDTFGLIVYCIEFPLMIALALQMLDKDARLYFLENKNQETSPVQ
jgi:cation transport ATPase